MSWKAGLRFKVYNPAHPIKYGIKSYVIADSITAYGEEQMQDVLEEDGAGGEGEENNKEVGEQGGDNHGVLKAGLGIGEAGGPR